MGLPFRRCPASRWAHGNLIVTTGRRTRLRVFPQVSTALAGRKLSIEGLNHFTSHMGLPVSSQKVGTLSPEP